MRKVSEQIGAEGRIEGGVEPSLIPHKLRIALRVGNYVHLLRAFGSVATGHALEDLRQAVAARLGPTARVSLGADGVVEALVADPAHALPLDRSGVHAGWFQAFLNAFTPYCADTASGPVLLSIAGLWIEGDQADAEDFDRLSEDGAQPPFQGDAPGSGRAWSARYRGDMATVIDLFRCIGVGAVGGSAFARAQQRPLRYALHWQPIRSISAPNEVLYYEAVLRLVDDHGAIQVPREAVSAAERLGFSSVLDLLGLRAVIHELTASSETSLGVKVSARSLADPLLWHELFAMLASDISLAPRLILEVSPDAAIFDVRGAGQQLDRLRQRGAIIALEGFGSGLASIRQLLALAPQIVKVDRLFLSCAGRSQRDRDRLCHLVGLGGTIASVVIVDGVETREQSQLASDAGAEWQQGDFMGHPGFFRPWRGRNRAKEEHPLARSAASSTQTRPSLGGSR